MANQRDFHHPYIPYPIQVDFMNALYDAIEDGCVGIFESPTGESSQLSAPEVQGVNVSKEQYEPTHLPWENVTADRVKGKSLSLICGALTWLREHKTDDLMKQLEAEDTGLN
jgi:chromosome transmission fidelity protein 1